MQNILFSLFISLVQFFHTAMLIAAQFPIITFCCCMWTKTVKTYFLLNYYTQFNQLRQYPIWSYRVTDVTGAIFLLAIIMAYRLLSQKIPLSCTWFFRFLIKCPIMQNLSFGVFIKNSGLRTLRTSFPFYMLLKSNCN